MPPESISDYVYSSKSDSFALGVLLFNLTSQRFPWKGKTKEELLENYRKKEMGRGAIRHLAPRMKHLLEGLLETNVSKRFHLLDCDF